MCSIQKGVLRNFTKFQARNFIKKETLAQVFSCEFCKISENIFPYRTPSVTASERRSLINIFGMMQNYMLKSVWSSFLSLHLDGRWSCSSSLEMLCKNTKNFHKIFFIVNLRTAASDGGKITSIDIA